MNVLLIGAGGREHALAYKINQSKKLSRLYISPGNPGTENYGENVSLDISDFKNVSDFCKNNKIELLLLGLNSHWLMV